MFIKVPLPLVLLCLFVAACTERVQVNAPPQDIWAVYGVLDLRADTQSIRISKGFLTEGSAIEYAGSHDLSVKGLEVTVSGNGKNYRAFQVDDVPKEEGIFFPGGTVYRFVTMGDQQLLENTVYELKILRPDDLDFQLSAYTRIPPEPRITFPAITGQLGEQCIPTVPFEDSVRVIFLTNTSQSKSRARSYEIRITLDYLENGIPKKYVYGPTKTFSKSRGCTGSAVSLCYELKRGVVITGMMARISAQANNSYPDFPLCGWPIELPQDLQLQVTGLDTFLSNYIFANNPVIPTFNTVQKEYTNIEGSGINVGVFGSIAYDNEPVLLTACAKYMLSMNSPLDSTVCD